MGGGQLHNQFCYLGNNGHGGGRGPGEGMVGREGWGGGETPYSGGGVNGDRDDSRSYYLPNEKNGDNPPPKS